MRGADEKTGGTVPRPRPDRDGETAGADTATDWADAVLIGGRFGAPSGALLDTIVAPPWLRVPECAGPVHFPEVPVTERVARRPRAVPPIPAHRPASAPVPSPRSRSARPRLVEEPSILGLSRRARSRLGSRLFTLFFVAVFALIFVQMLVEILHG